MHPHLFLLLCLARLGLCEDEAGGHRWIWQSRATPERQKASRRSLLTHSPPLVQAISLAPQTSFPQVQPFEVYDDGTVKSRIIADTLPIGIQHGGDDSENKPSYTTLDKFFSERGIEAPLPTDPKHLGGLRPEEVFYANEDLLILNGGTLGNNVYVEYPKKNEELYLSLTPEHPTHGKVIGSRRIIPNEEYNGNVPVFVPYPQAETSQYAVFVPHMQYPVMAAPTTHPPRLQIPYLDYEGSSLRPLKTVSSSAYKPFIFLPYQQIHVQHAAEWVPHVQVNPAAHSHYPVHPTHPPQGLYQPSKTIHSLHDDIKVNFIYPRPQINPEAEFLLVDNSIRKRKDHRMEKLPYEVPHQRPIMADPRNKPLL